MTVTATSESGATASVQMTSGGSCKITLDNYRMGDAIDVNVEGYQDMDRGAYFFEPYVEDGNVRERSQNLIGVSFGLTPVACSVHLEPLPMMLRKVNREGEALPGAEFSMYIVSSEVPGGRLLVDTYRTNGQGEILLSNLVPGATYELQEVKAPVGYAMLKTPVRFEVVPGVTPVIELTKNYDKVELEDGVLTIVNDPALPNPNPNPDQLDTMPATGNSSMPGVWMLLMLVCALGAALLRRRSVRV